MLITSLSNPRIKHLVRLGSSRRHRDRAGQTIVEGIREIKRCLNAGIQPVEAYLCPDLIRPDDSALAQRTRDSAAAVFEIPTALFEKVAYRGGSGGIVLVIASDVGDLDSLPLSANPFLIVVEGAEKPGNLGAILRSADAAGVDGLILCRGGTDLHNPNVIRASLGTRFTVPLAEGGAEEVSCWLAQRKIQRVAATPDAQLLYTRADLTGPTALIVGSEAQGLSNLWLDGADERVCIPMAGAADSLNLATSTTLLLYEVVRQRSVA